MLRTFATVPENDVWRNSYSSACLVVRSHTHTCHSYYAYFDGACVVASGGKRCCMVPIFIICIHSFMICIYSCSFARGTIVKQHKRQTGDTVEVLHLFVSVMLLLGTPRSIPAHLCRGLWRSACSLFVERKSSAITAHGVVPTCENL